MLETTQNKVKEIENADPRWVDLYRIGFVACVLLAISIPLAILAYFIWPYTPGFTSLENIFATLQVDRLAGLMSLDLSVILLEPITILQVLALYVALKQVNESYALIALVLGLMGVILWLTSRPLVEMTYLSGQYAAAATEAAKNQYLAAGETFHALFNGTAWMLSQFMISISGTISDVLMLKSKYFSKATAYVGFVLAITGFTFWIPVIGIPMALVGTLGGTVWFVLMARDFFRLGWGSSPTTQTNLSGQAVTD
jgi:hypothetical protein